MTETKNRLAIFLITTGTVFGLAATDLILPSIPVLPNSLAGTAEMAQWVLASFAFGTGLGLLLFGELGARYRVIDVLIYSLIAFGILSFAATRTSTLVELSAVRFFQGIAASAPAVFAPVMVNRLYDGARAVAMLGRIGSIESMAPAIAPIVGAALLTAFGWRSSFYLVAFGAFALATAWLAAPTLRRSFSRLERIDDGYLALFRNSSFLRYALSQACTLGALLVIVFSAPKVIISGLDGGLSDFIVMQVIGILFFVIAANTTGTYTRWWDSEGAVMVGSALSAAGCAGILIIYYLDGYLFCSWV